MIIFEITIKFPESNGLIKELELQHTIPFQLNQLAHFWSQQHGITSTIVKNEDNSEKIVTYSIPSTETREQFEQHAEGNGVDIKELVSTYRAEIEKLGGTLEFTISDDIPD
jgi:hypothetical protein